MSAVRFIVRGMPPEQANVIVAQIAGGASVPALMARGFSQPLASEIAAQIAAGGTPPVRPAERLMALGVGPALATEIVDAIAEANA
jgi:hypothetical protein